MRPGVEWFGQEPWRHRMLAAVPGAWRRRVERLHSEKKQKNERAGNVWLRDLGERFAALRVPINLSDSELIEMGNKCAAECMALAGVGAMTMEALRGRLERYCERYAITPPERQRITKRGNIVGVPDGPAIARMTDSLWWRGRLRKSQARAIEKEAIGLGYVHRKAEIYVSDATAERRMQQRARNAAMLEATQAINLTTGQEYTLAALAAVSVANPRIRRGELMTRISGFESVANGVGHVAVFVTVTTPSRFHARMVVNDGKSVIENPKHNGATPRDGQRYLSGMWARVRAAWARAKLALYGFRIAEPHHDGTPHWHLVLFMAQQAKRQAMQIFASYARAEDAHELADKKAKRARFYAKDIDPSQGSATGYVTKYVSKNIDGYGVQGNIEGGHMDAVTGSRRVEAWASTWGIRQFQQIGGPPVGVWRELRRIKEKIEGSELADAARVEADCGGRGKDRTGTGSGTFWANYVQIMGGPVVKRVDLPLRVAKSEPGERIDGETGEVYRAPMTRYGEIAPGFVFGVRDVVAGVEAVSRGYRWQVSGKGRVIDERKWAGVNTSGAESWKGWKSYGAGSVVDFDGTEIGSFRFGFHTVPDLRGLAGMAGPWTRVNNCTEGESDGGGSESARVGDAPQIRREQCAYVRGGDDFAGGSQATFERAGGNHRATGLHGRTAGRVLQ